MLNINRRINKKLDKYGILIGAKYFSENGSQNYFILQPLLRCFHASKITVNAKVLAWKTKGLSDESIKPPATSDNSLSPTLDYFNNTKFRVKFNRSCLSTDTVFTPNNVIICTLFLK